MPTSIEASDPSESDPFANGMKLEWMDPRTLQPHASNHRIHPQNQRAAFAAALDDLGWLTPLVMNRTTGNLLDGHMRRQDALERNLDRVPVIVLEISPEKELVALGLIDRISAMAMVDARKNQTLSEALAARNATLAALIQAPGAADQKERNVTQPAVSDDKLAVGLLPGEGFNYVTLLFKREVDWLAAMDHFGLERQTDPFHSRVGISRVVDGAAYLRRIIR